jgi:ligand-binding sensor domain-containing protein
MNFRLYFGLLLPAAISTLFLAPGCKKAADSVTPPPGPPWVTIARSTTPQLLDNKINSLNIDQSGRVWIATDSGANYFHKGVWGRIRDSLRYSAFSTGGTIDKYVIRYIEPGKQASIWFGLDGGGVRRWREGATRSVWQTYRIPDLTFDVAQSISADKLVNGDVWVATTFGVSRFIPSVANPEFGTWHRYYSPDLPSNQVYASAINPFTNRVWFGTQDGFGMYDDMLGDWTAFDLPPVFNYKINSMTFDGSGTLWLAKLEGVTSFNLQMGEWHHYDNLNTGGMLPAGAIHAVTTDMVTTRWFGTDQGLVRFSDSTWTTFNMSNTPELPDNVVTSVIYDKMGNLWVGTEKGLAIFNPEGTRF